MNSKRQTQTKRLTSYRGGWIAVEVNTPSQGRASSHSPAPRQQHPGRPRGHVQPEGLTPALKKRAIRSGCLTAWEITKLFETFKKCIPKILTLDSFGITKCVLKLQAHCTPNGKKAC